MTPDGTITTLYSFSGGSDGATPLRQPAARQRWPFLWRRERRRQRAGTVFAITASGALTTLRAFSGGDGTGPVDTLVEGDDGYLYGVGGGGYRATAACTACPGTGGKFTTLHLFTTRDGVHPASAPIFGSDGRLYGTTPQYGGAPGATAACTPSTSPRRACRAHLTKTCHNEFNMCMRPFNTSVGQFVSLDWASANVSACRASGAWGTVPGRRRPLQVPGHPARRLPIASIASGRTDRPARRSP